MQLSLYQIDAFANKLFEGNPAAVFPLDEWLPNEIMQSIAMENNLSETAFFVKKNNRYHIRWFTPSHEVDLCGHATLASAFVIFNILGHQGSEILFDSISGLLRVTQSGDWIEMDFPSLTSVECVPPIQILEAFSEEPIECLCAEDYVLVFKDECSVFNANPNIPLLAELDLRGVAITSKSKDYDFITRFFAPKYGVNEDPVTGSAFTQLIPYWAKKLNKLNLSAKQVSKRGGIVRCVDAGERVKISGTAVKYMEGTIEIKAQLKNQ